MRVRVRLFFHLKRHGPGGSGDFALELEPGATVGQVLAGLGMAPGPAKVLLVNGRQAGLDSPLAQDDELVVFPPVEGG